MSLGFKTRAIREQDAKDLLDINNSLSNEVEETIGVSPVVAETINRLENLSNFIISKEFSELNEEAKQIALNDFHYLSQVSTII